MNDKLKVFISYSHEDEVERKALDPHLKILERQGVLDVWHDHMISAGGEWEIEINEKLEACHIILLLITANFLASNYCYCFEMKRAIERHSKGEARVIPIIFRDTYWKETPISKFSALPTDAKPVYSKHWYHSDEAFKDIVIGIRKVVDEFASDFKASLISDNRLRASLLQLDYKKQGDVFKNFLQGGYRIGGFLIYGKPEYGQDWLLNRLMQRLNDQSRFKQIEKVFKLNFESKTLSRNVETLWRVLAAEMGIASTGNFLLPEKLIEAAHLRWQTQTVVFILRNPAKLGEKGIKLFLEDFWFPLTTMNAKSLSISSPYCLLFLIDNENILDKWTIDNTKGDLVTLDKLTQFHSDEVNRWIDFESQGWPRTPKLQDIFDDGDDINTPEHVLDRICGYFGYDWIEKERTWLKY